MAPIDLRARHSENDPKTESAARAITTEAYPEGPLARHL